jgi:hypothetical protein
LANLGSSGNTGQSPARTGHRAARQKGHGDIAADVSSQASAGIHEGRIETPRFSDFPACLIDSALSGLAGPQVIHDPRADLAYTLAGVRNRLACAHDEFIEARHISGGRVEFALCCLGLALHERT